MKGTRKRFLTVGVVLLLPALLSAEGAREQFLTIYYTSSLNGNLDGCACESSPRGGLVKRAAFLRARPRADSVLVDAGDVLDVTPDSELTRHLLEVYGELGYDAIAVGDQELSDGADALREYAARYPLVSNNLSITTGGAVTPLGSSPLSIRKGSARLAVISLIDPDVFALYPKQLKAQVSVTPPAAALPALLDEARVPGDSTARVTILLYHGSLEAAAELVKGTQGIDVVIAGHEQRLVHPTRVGNTILASPGEDGNRVGMLRLKLRDGEVVGYSNEFRLFQYEKDPDDSSVRTRIDRYRDAMRAKVKSP